MDIKSLMMDRQNVIIIVLAAAILIFSSYAITGFLTVQPDTGDVDQPGSDWTITTFTDEGKGIELIDGKPVIRMFSTTWCSHCQWAGPVYDEVVKEYVDAGKIVAYHWQLDTNDNTLTDEIESEIPESELAVYKEFNPRGSIPTYVFGGTYKRIGNGFERTGDLESEKNEFRAVIEQVIRDAGL
jgi:thiol-disulfide isomerase/thioredoxin